MRFHDEDVRKIGECRAVGNHASKPHLFSRPVETDRNRIIDGTLEEIARNVFRPVTSLQKSVNHIHIQESPVVCDQQVSVRPIMWQGLLPI